MVHKTITYNSSNYQNGEEIYIFKMQKRIKIKFKNISTVIIL